MDKQKLKLLDELMEQARYLSLWLAEGFRGPEQQKMFMHERLVRAEQCLYDANVVLSRLCEEIPSNLRLRVSDNPVWLPSMLKWVQEKSKEDDKARAAADLSRRQQRAAERDKRHEAEPVSRFVFIKVSSTGETLTRLSHKMELFESDEYKPAVENCGRLLVPDSLDPKQFRLALTGDTEFVIDWKPLSDGAVLATVAKSDVPRTLVLFVNGVSLPNDRDAIDQLRRIVVDRFPTFPRKKLLPLRTCPRPLALAVQLRNELDLPTDHAAISLGAAYFRTKGGYELGAG